MAPGESTDDIDDQVLALRRKGTAFPSIARTVGLAKASDANLAFNRALRRLPDAEAAGVRTEEEGRLDRLADLTRANDSFTKEELERRLGVIERLRSRLHRD